MKSAKARHLNALPRSAGCELHRKCGRALIDADPEAEALVLGHRRLKLEFIIITTTTTTTTGLFRTFGAAHTRRTGAKH